MPVQTEVYDYVARFTIRRPDLHNAFDEALIAEITAAFCRLGGEQDVRAIVLASEGKSFSAGADVHWMKRMVDYSFDENVADAQTLADMLEAIRSCPKPVIARVHGAALGGGVGLVAACDMAVALSSAVFCLSEVRLGIVPAVISPFVLERIGVGHARRYALTAERFDAAEAKRIGLISEVVDTVEQLDQWIALVCGEIKKNGPEAMAVCKRILRDVPDADWKSARELTTRTIAERRVSAEGQEGLKAFLEKRSPNWAAGD
ncbi:MAG: enoyl-CoA hydratase/isomerase family protein [Phycisphaerales bacterium]|nr:enoyl-CoA hydratase/isomerase family protein [Phycisphaerales bacterium]